MSLTNLKDKAEMVLLASITGLGWKGGFWDVEDEGSMEDLTVAVNEMYHQMLTEIIGDVITLPGQKLPAVRYQRMICLACQQEPITISTFMLMQETLHRTEGLVGQFITYCTLCDQYFIFRFAYPPNWRHGLPIVIQNLQVQPEEFTEDGPDPEQENWD